MNQGVLPESLIELNFCDDYDRSLEPNVLPKSLIKLKFGNKFNQKIQENVLPQSLTELSLVDILTKSLRSTRCLTR